jgi:hypothetical protein
MTKPISFFPSGRDVPMVANTLGKKVAARLGGYHCPACDLRAAIKSMQEQEMREAREALDRREVTIRVKSKNSAEKPAQGE